MFQPAADQYFYCNSINCHYSYSYLGGGGGGCFRGQRDREIGERQRLAAEQFKRIYWQAGRWKEILTKVQSWEKKRRELAFLWSKPEWKSLVYWILYVLHLISHSSITGQPGLVNSSHTDEQVACLLDTVFMTLQPVSLLTLATGRRLLTLFAQLGFPHVNIYFTRKLHQVKYWDLWIWRSTVISLSGLKLGRIWLKIKISWRSRLEITSFSTALNDCFCHVSDEDRLGIPPWISSYLHVKILLWKRGSQVKTKTSLENIMSM